MLNKAFESSLYNERIPIFNLIFLPLCPTLNSQNEATHKRTVNCCLQVLFIHMKVLTIFSTVFVNKMGGNTLEVMVINYATIVNIDVTALINFNQPRHATFDRTHIHL